MREITLMNPSKETDNKLRWSAEVDGVVFKLYIPKWRVPTPWPARLKVFVDAQGDAIRNDGAHRSHSRPRASEDPVVATVEKVTEHTETVRYRPTGDPDEWETGEPYVPYSLLPTPTPARLRLEVQWDRSEGTWGDE